MKVNVEFILSPKRYDWAIGFSPNTMTNGVKKERRKGKTERSADNEPFYFLSLEIEKVLCFKDSQILNLSNDQGSPAQWTVILGDNGVGKTTLLRCLAVIESSQESIQGHDLQILMTGPGSQNIDLWQEGGSLGRSSARILNRLAVGAKLSSQINHPSHDTSKRIQEIKPEIFFASSRLIEVKCEPTEDAWAKLMGFVRYGYGATRRMGKTSLTEASTNNSESLFSDDASLINAEEWLLQTDYAARSASGKTHDRLQAQLHQIIDILKRILPDVEDIRITPADEEIPRPRAEFLTPYGWVRLSSLGLGYRTAIAWMVDLAVRLFRRYPNSPDPLAEPAIVLVDEIDLHLHPKWQRNIMSFLTERFPNTQFIVTAHSPLVVQAAKDANIVLLRREGDRVVIDNNPEIIENWRVDQVLTSVFELPTARPTDVEPLLTRRRELLAKSRLSKADKTELQDLDQRIGALPTAETLDDIKAMDIIRRAAQLLENS
jgi:predicted ATP-binding protein involved in virulence